MDEMSTSGIQIAYETVPSKQIHWHDTLQIIYLLNGKAKITVNGQQYLMHKTDFVVMNPFELHNVELLGASSALSFHFSQALLSKLQGAQFECMTCLYPQKEQSRFDPIRAELAAVFELHFGAPSCDGELELFSHVYELMHQLSRSFRKQGSSSSSTEQPRISRILQYMNTHYAEEITLGEVAAQEFLSPNYLSQFFRDKLDTTFTQYLNDIRLNHGFFELCNTEKSITEIALDNGFGRVDTFIERFRRKYSITPGKFRKGLTSIQSAGSGLLPSTQEQDIQPGTRFQELTKYAVRKMECSQSRNTRQQKLSVSAAQQGRAVRHKWKYLINAGYADDLLSINVQQQLAEIQRTIGFEYVRFHGIFSDTMHIYEEDTTGRLLLHFTHSDLLLDQILALDAKPYLEFSFLPRALAPGQTYVYQNFSYIGFPDDIGKWKQLVIGFLTHCIQRYGLYTVRQWRFTLFSITFAHYGFLTENQYCVLFDETRRAVKQVDSCLQFGGPGIEGSVMLDNALPKETFFHYCMEHSCVPDFVTMQSYPHTTQEIISDFNRLVHQNDYTVSFGLSSNENFMSDAIREAQALLARLGWSSVPLWIEECGSTIWPRDLCSDTCYRAVHIVKNLTENMDRTVGNAYWTLSDLINDWKTDKQLFHGGHGIFTCNGIPKAAFYAFQFLARMGDELLSAGDGWYITRGGGQIQVLLYHYCHYNAMYQKLLELQNPRERYSAFQPQSPVEYRIDFSGIEGTRFTCEHIRIGRDSGSAYDEWVRLGSPEELSPDNQAYLCHRSEPVRWIEQRDTLRDIHVTLEPLEVVQIIISII